MEYPREPLVINLEDSLLRTNLAIESLFALAKRDPLYALQVAARFFDAPGRAVGLLEGSQSIDPATLPYDVELLSRIGEQRSRGVPVQLFSRRYRQYAQAVAAHLKCFDKVIVPEAGATLDRSVTVLSRRLVLANRGSQAACPVRLSAFRAWLSAIRLHQWLKNLLIFVPLLSSHWVRERTPLLHASLAFLLFGLCASSVYLLNDVFDLADDRYHATKRFRALAQGRIRIEAALCVVPSLFVCSILGAWWLLPPAFSVALVAYYVVTLVYSLALKRIMMLDVVILALLYTLRMVAGTVAINGVLTFWMLAFSLFIFMSLALAKRYAELIGAKPGNMSEKIRGRGYFPSDLPMISSLGAASGYISVMVLALYIQDQNTIALYAHPRIIWFACPLLLFWLGRTWMLTHRGHMHDDPLVFAIRDRVSLVVAALFGLVFILAA